MNFYRIFVGFLLLLIIILVNIYSENLFIIVDDNLEKIRVYSDTLGELFLIIYFLIYILLTSLSLPVALLLGLLSGILFDLYTAVILISFASSIGATIAMLMSRYLFSNYIKNKYNKYITVINEDFKSNGLFYLFALRMTVVMPYFIINLAFGLIKINTLRYYLITQIGMLPGSTIIIMIGQELTNLIDRRELISAELIILLTLAGILPIVIKKIYEKVKVQKA